MFQIPLYIHSINNAHFFSAKLINENTVSFTVYENSVCLMSMY